MAKKRRSKIRKPFVCEQHLAMITPPSPFYAPDWRWQRALLGAPLPDDLWSTRLAECGSDSSAEAVAAGQRLSPNDPVLSMTHEIYFGDELRRGELEARVLADQFSLEISQRMQIPSVLIEAYEAVYFDARRSLKCVSWVLFCCLNLKPSYVFDRHSVANLWRIYGFREGAKMVDLLTSRVDRDKLLRDGIDAYLEPEVDLPASLKREIGYGRLPRPQMLEALANRDYLADQLRAYEKYERQCGKDLAAPLSSDRRSRRSYPTDDPVLAAIRNFLKSQA